MSNPSSSIVMWQVVNLLALGTAVFLVVRYLKKRNNKNLVLLLGVGLMAQSCATQDKTTDPTPVSSKANHDIALGEVVVIGHRDILLPAAYFFEMNTIDQGGFGGSSRGGGGGAGGGGGSTGGSGGDGGSQGIPNETYNDNPDNGMPPEPQGNIHVLRFNAGQTLTHNVMVVIDKGQITEVKSYYSGLTVGSTYTQDAWTQSYSNGTNFTFEFVFHFDYSLFLEGIGTVGAGAPVKAIGTFDSSTGQGSIKYILVK